MTNEILNSDVYKEMESVQNPSLVYPDCESFNFRRIFFLIILFFKGFMLTMQLNLQQLVCN